MQEGGGAEANVDSPSQFAAGEAMQFRIQLLEERFRGRSVALFRCLNERRNRLHTASGCPEDVPVSLIHKRLSTHQGRIGRIVTKLKNSGAAGPATARVRSW